MKNHTIARLVLAFTYALVAIVIGLLIWQITAEKSSKHTVAWVVGGCFVMIAVPLSVYDIVSHLMHYTEPLLQRFIVRILWMVPIYALESWLALRFKEQAIYLESARECYEAYVIHAFYKLMERWLGTTQMLQDKCRAKTEKTVHHMFPMCCLPKWKLSTTFIRQCRIGVFQYVVIKIVLTAVTFLAVKTDNYHEGELTNFGAAYIYVTVIANFSQVWAMYCLVLFYHTLEKELAGLNPLPKLLCIKAVVFFTFWQSMVIAGLAHYEVLKPTLTYSQDEVAAGLQDLYAASLLTL